MARMFPQRLRLETKSDAERHLYDALQRSLPDDFVVFHSVRWLAQDPQSGPREGETDFIIAHPTLGILVLEVKGGCIRYDGALAQWYSNDIPIKDPVLQARESKHSLLGKLKGLPEWRDRWITVGYAVAFPDVEVNRDLLPDLPEPLVLDAPAMTDLPAWVRRALEYWHAHDRQAGAIGERGMHLLQDILSPSWELRPSLRFAVQREEEEIHRLTEEQLRHVQHYFTATKPAKSKGGLPYWRFSHTHTVWARILRNHLASKVHPLRTRSDCTLKRSTS
jgi:hypothetical protein